jgi:hypothetical protein
MAWVRSALRSSWPPRTAGRARFARRVRGGDPSTRVEEGADPPPGRSPLLDMWLPRLHVNAGLPRSGATPSGYRCGIYRWARHRVQARAYPIRPSPSHAGRSHSLLNSGSAALSRPQPPSTRRMSSQYERSRCCDRTRLRRTLGGDGDPHYGVPSTRQHEDRPAQHPRDTDASRSEAVDLNRVITSSAGNAESYRGVHEPGGHESEWQVPRASCSIRAQAVV